MTETVLDYESDAICELMEVEEEARTDDWLQSSLQQAIMLELATLPPYLCGYWSMIEKTEEDKKISFMIREIIFDEMSHLGHVCNLLTTIGGSAHRGHEGRGPLPLQSAGRSAPQPSGRRRPGQEPDRLPERADQEIGRDVLPNRGAREAACQVRGRGRREGLFAIKNLADAEKAIKIIQEQGEGTHSMPENPHDGYEGELAHYYTFRQLYRGKKLIKVQEQPPKWDFEGAAITMPGALPMGVVPKGGWAKDKKTEPDAQVQKLLKEFNNTFSSMLRSLELAWQQDSPKDAETHMSDAVAEMYNLGGPALQLMEKPLPNDPAKRYGPEFLYIPKKP
ncbi:ferritin-like protein [Streptomyces sp. Ag109_G2-15]|uniref:ferritin-like protein n=1 Tax=Streptomyces sp. Ag109_G2-15 TaxID=1938850 RepID=UPI000BD11AC5|nr:ferritin-like protein [Streptomyces sp. Ag109_G2-15]SOE08204.1 Ferritin-like [Streptomyces sp. Ag109_G2-15]